MVFGGHVDIVGDDDDDDVCECSLECVVSLIDQLLSVDVVAA